MRLTPHWMRPLDEPAIALEEVDGLVVQAPDLTRVKSLRLRDVEPWNPRVRLLNEERVTVRAVAVHKEGNAPEGSSIEVLFPT